MEKVIEEYKDCDLCPLSDFRGREGYNNIVFYRGSTNADVCIIGEAPGENEAIAGKAFVGRAGGVLDKILLEMNDERFIPENTHLTNICMCRPPNNRAPYKKEILACMQRLTMQVSAVNPKILIAMGNVALKALTGKTGITRMRGLLGKAENVLCPSFKTRWVIANGEEPKGFMVGATFHPASVFRGSDQEKNNKLAGIKTDMMLFKRILNRMT